MESSTKTNSEIDKIEKNENNKKENNLKMSSCNQEDYNKKEKSGEDLISNNFIYKSNNSQSSFPLLFK